MAPDENEQSANVLNLIDNIKTEMKRIGYWSNNPPDLASKVASGEIKSYLDAPSFELWLQCIFIPNATKAAKNNSLPKKSQVGLMAMRQYNYHSFVEEAQPLLELLYKFDAEINK